MTATLPTTTTEITAQWMTEALRGSGVIPSDVSVGEVILDPAGAGLGFMGEVTTVGLVYDGVAGEAPTTIVAKFPPQSPEIRAMMHPTRIYEREHRFYRELANETPLRTPEIYHVTCDPAAEPADERYLILMEDLSALTLGDQVAGTTADQAATALAGLGAHHARFWNGAGLEAADFIPVIDGPLNQAGGPIYEASLPGFMEAFGKEVKPELETFVAGYAAQRPRILDELAAMPHTLVHFDFRADNLFFDGGSVAVIDWQAISQGGGAADVGYFLTQNMSTDERRANEDDLLQVYLDALIAGGVTGYDMDALRRDYRVGIECGWIIPVLAVGSLDFTSERAIALWTEVIARTQAALVDHDLQA
jgi:hypothetical protein